MPKGLKSKGHSRGGKHQSARGEHQRLQRAQPSAEGPAAAPPPAAQGDSGESSSTSQAAFSTGDACGDALTKKTSMLLHFLLDKYQKRDIILKGDMQNVAHRKYKPHFSHIVRRVSIQLELVYGLELKQRDRKGFFYHLVRKEGPSTENSLCSMKELPKKGLLMTLLGVIVMKGNRATEEDVWGFLNALGIYAGKRNVIFGEPQKLITRDLIQHSYLEYIQVPGNIPPSYEFIWGPRAHAETNKNKVLEFLANISGTTPRAFPRLYEEPFKEKPERPRRDAPKVPHVSKSRVHAACKSTTDYSLL
uniref:melanoma-associated antigen B4-like n=1 Tax=Jaculus jaculus TaxID=51337 RepID=UPI001E1B2053|nr:melanoma-associated antigen B4-like [Jaculus jaculus]XP_044996462.1 melanoma-associated antigen B4-like [Jaculus jaculus]